MTYDESAKIYHNTEDLKWLLGKWNAFKTDFRIFLEIAEAPSEMASILHSTYQLICEHCEKIQSDIKAGTEKIKFDYPTEIKIDGDSFEKIYNQRYEDYEKAADDTPFVPIDCVFNTPESPIDYVALGMGF